MKAIKINKPGEIYVSEIPDAKWKKGYAVIEVKALGVCGSDVHAGQKYSSLSCLQLHHFFYNREKQKIYCKIVGQHHIRINVVCHRKVSHPSV